MFSFRSRIFAALLTFAALDASSAQTPPAAPPTQTPVAVTTPQAPAGPDRVHYGVRFGPSFTTLTNVDSLDPTAAAAAFEPTLNFGGFATLQLTQAIAFQPEVLFAAKGHRIRDRDATPVPTSSGELELPAADRVILVRYLEVPLLVRLSKRTHENTSIYLIGGPAIALRRNAVIREVSNPGRHEDIDDLISGSNFLYIVGGGVEHRRWLADARITRGARSVAVDPTRSPVKTGAFSVLIGVRF
jgi:hypothetical protein